MDEKRFFSRRDLVFFAGLLAAAGLLFFLTALSPKGTTAIVERGGEILLSKELAQLSGPEDFAVEGENGISLTIVLSPNGAEVSASGCPDQVCVRTGKITRAGESALCLPARVSVRLAGGFRGADAATY